MVEAWPPHVIDHHWALAWRALCGLRGTGLVMANLSEHCFSCGRHQLHIPVLQINEFTSSCVFTFLFAISVKRVLSMTIHQILSWNKNSVSVCRHALQPLFVVIKFRKCWGWLETRWCLMLCLLTIERRVTVSSRFTDLNAALRIWNCLKAQFYTNLPGLVWQHKVVSYVICNII